MSEPSSCGFPDFSKLEKAQDILDRNRHILYQIKANHDSQRSEALAKNFALIKEVNMNISKVMQVYVQISDDYVAFMRQQRPDSGSDAADQPAEQQVGNGNDKCSGGGDNTGIDNGDGSAPEQDNNES